MFHCKTPPTKIKQTWAIRQLFFTSNKPHTLKLSTETLFTLSFPIPLMLAVFLQQSACTETSIYN